MAESGSPFAIALARHTTSGTIPACSNAHITPVRPNPVWTSSAMSTMPCSSQNERRPRRNAAGRRRVAALALDRLDEDRADRLGRHDARGQVAQVAQAALGRRRLVAAEVAVRGGEGQHVDARQQRLVAAPVVQVGARDRCRPEGPAVEGAAEGDDARPARHPAGELERRLDRLGARVHEEDRVERLGERRRELVGQADRRLRVADRGRGHDEPVDLLVDRRGHRRVMVAERRDGDPVGEVEVGPPAVSYSR